MGLADSSEVSWMNIADEGTTAHLKAGAQPEKSASQMGLANCTHIVNECFERWGLPKSIKIDNGYPFVNPNYMNVPSKAKLWWIGLGIEVIQNTPRRPQENGAVECLQGICSRWVNPSTIPNIEQLQVALDEMSDFQRMHYQIPDKNYKTRVQLHPDLMRNPRLYDPTQFDIGLVYQYLSKQVWKRRIKKNGSVHFFGQPIYLGTRFGEQDTFISFDPFKKQWIFRDKKGLFLKSSENAVPQENEILEFAVISKNV